MPPSSKSRQRLQRRPSRLTCAKITVSGPAAPLNSRSEYLPMPTAFTTRAEEFREQLARRAMVADGAMGTMLYSRGVFINRCFDELNISAPDMVRQIHQEYVKAGAEILETNTFGANRTRLAAFGLAEKLRAINQAGVRLAREAARENAFVAGAIGPLGAHIEPLGPTSFAEARAIFREQVDVLVDAGGPPLGAHIEPLGPTSFAEARAIFREQVEVLLDAGVDLLILET